MKLNLHDTGFPAFSRRWENVVTPLTGLCVSCVSWLCVCAVSGLSVVYRSGKWVARSIICVAETIIPSIIVVRAPTIKATFFLFFLHKLLLGNRQSGNYKNQCLSTMRTRQKKKKWEKRDIYSFFFFFCKNSIQLHLVRLLWIRSNMGSSWHKNIKHICISEWKSIFTQTKLFGQNERTQKLTSTFIFTVFLKFVIYFTVETSQNREIFENIVRKWFYDEHWLLRSKRNCFYIVLLDGRAFCRCIRTWTLCKYVSIERHTKRQQKYNERPNNTFILFLFLAFFFWFVHFAHEKCTKIQWVKSRT